MRVEVDPEVNDRGLRYAYVRVEGVDPGADASELVDRVTARLQEQFDLNGLKDDPIVRAYRDYLWSIDVDPTKVRPAGEALLRRALRGNFPRINAVVDSYNLASAEYRVPISCFDADKLTGDLVIRPAESEEVMVDIAGERMELDDRFVVVADEDGPVSVSPYRDARRTAVTDETERVLLLAHGVPGVEVEHLVEALKTAVRYLREGAEAESASRIVTP
ncbi:B3/B4 domain-containing protein [Methanopyrus sp.]